MNVMVTGSHGYIGSILCKTLTEQGYDVYACDNKLRLGGDFRYIKNVYNTSFEDDIVVQSILNNNIQTIFHLAASSLLGPSATDPLLYYWNNTAKTITLLHKLTKAGWKGHIIFSSTAAVYGDQSFHVSETADLKPCNHYGKSKLMCEQALSVAEMYGIKTTAFRYFNVAGAYDDIGQDSGEPHIISRICDAAIRNTALTIFGNDYQTRDGTCVRDYVHVRDVCRAQIHAMEMQLVGTYNLGTRQGTSTRELIELFKEINNVKVPSVDGDRREGDPSFLVANPDKFVDTGFEYKYSNTPYILASAWNYYRGKYNGI
jgi:UDP-glucose 4-epimerase